MRGLLLAFVMVAGPGYAADWTPLDGEGIESALSGKSLDYGDATQDFRASGATDYFAGRPSTGQWAVRGDQYCSIWPPSDSWTCYDVDLSEAGDKVRFRGVGDDITIGTYISAK